MSSCKMFCQPRQNVTSVLPEAGQLTGAVDGSRGSRPRIGQTAGGRSLMGNWHMAGVAG